MDKRKESSRRDSASGGGRKKVQRTGGPEKRFSKSEKPKFDRDKTRPDKKSDRSGTDKPVLKKSPDRKFSESSEKRTWSDKPRKTRQDADSGRGEKRYKPAENSTDEKRRGFSRNNSAISTKNERPRLDDNRRTRSFEKSIKKKVIGSSEKSGGDVRLNKYIANSGICSRREADVLIATGVVKVNGEVVSTMGYQVKPADKVTVDGREMKSERKVYLLLNKPKDTITTTDDPSGRKTVMEVIKGACRERIYPVGRLDRNTTGLLIMTNDGEMAKRLMHPSHKIIKVYDAVLDKNLTKDDMLAISQGVTIEEDFIPIDGIAWSDSGKRNEVGIELHSGKYHVVKRIFEQFGYDVIKLDRTMFGPLTKKNLPRGTWRMLTDDEISILHRL